MPSARGHGGGLLLRHVWPLEGDIPRPAVLPRASPNARGARHLAHPRGARHLAHPTGARHLAHPTGAWHLAHPVPTFADLPAHSEHVRFWGRAGAKAGV